MATLRFNGTNQYFERSTLTGGLESVTVGAHTLVMLVRRGSAGFFQDPFAIANSARTLVYAGIKFRDTSAPANAVAYDASRLGVDDGTAWTSTTNWLMTAVTLDTADTPDAVFHRRDHTANAAWTHINGSGSPAYGGASTPGSSGIMQHGRWLTGDWFNGDVALVGAWAARLTNAQLDELKANDRTSDWWNCSVGPPLYLVECNLAEASLVDLAGHSVRVAPANAPTLTGGDPDRWTFDGTGATAAIPPNLVMAPYQGAY